MNADPEALVTRIEAAFARMPLPRMTLQQAARDTTVSVPDSRGAGRPRRWQELADAEVAKYGKAFYGADVESWVVFVPAWMRWSLRHYRSSDSFVVDQAIYALDPNHNLGRFAYFTDEQSRVILDYLSYMSKQDDWVDATVAQQNIDRYWHRFAN